MNFFSEKTKFLILLWLSHFFVDFCTGIWSIHKTLSGMDITAAGLIAGLSGFLGEILQPVFGFVSDRGHYKKMLILGIALSSLILFVPFINNLLFSFLLLICLNAGSSAFHPCASGILPTLYTTNKARALLLFSSGGAVGFGLSQIVFCSFFYSYKNCLIALLAFPLLCILYIFFKPIPYENSKNRFSYFQDFLKLIHLHKKSLFFLYASQVVYQAIRSSFLFFLPEILRSRCSHPWVWQGGGFLFFVFGSAFSLIIAGYISDQYSIKKILLYALSGTIVLFYLLAFSTNLSVGNCLVLLTCLGAFFGIINPLTISWGHHILPDNPSTVSGLLMGLAWCLGNLGPAITGICFQKSEPLTLSVLGVFFVMIFFLLWSTPFESHDKGKILMH